MANAVFSVRGVFEDNLSSGISSVNSQTKNLTSSLKSLAAAFGLAFGASAVINGTKRMITSTVQLGDKIDKTSQKVGLSIKEFQQWDHVMQLSGTSMDEAAMGLQRFQKNLVDAQYGIGTATDALDNLGIELKDTNGNFRNSGQVFEEVVLGLADMEDTTLRNAMAQDIFGRAGARLVPLLNQSSEAIKENLGELEELGAVIGDDQVKAAARLNDMWTRLNKTIDKLKFDILLPIMEDLSDAFEEMLKSGELKKRINTLAITVKDIYTAIKDLSFFIKENFILLAIGGLIVTIPTLVSAIYSVQAAIAALTATMAANPFLLLGVAVAGAIVGIIKFMKKQEELQNSMKGTVTAIEKEKKATQELMEEYEEFEEVLKNDKAAINDLQIAKERYGKYVNYLVNRVNNLKAVQDANVKISGTFEEKISQLSTAIQALRGDTVKLTGGLVKLEDLQKRNEEASKKTGEQFATQAVRALELEIALQGIRDVVDGYSDSFSDAVSNYKKLFIDLRLGVKELKANLENDLGGLEVVNKEKVLLETKDLENSYNRAIDEVEDNIKDMELAIKEARLERLQTSEIANEEEKRMAREILDERIKLIEKEKKEQVALFFVIKNFMSGTDFRKMLQERKELRLQQESELLDNIKEMTKQYTFNIATQRKEIEQQILEESGTNLSQQFDFEMEMLERKHQTELKSVENNEEAKKELIEKYNQEKILLNEQYANKFKNTLGDALTKTSGMWASYFKQRAEQEKTAQGESTAASKQYGNIYKAFAITQATIDTYQSAVSSYKAMASIPFVGPALGVAAAANAIAFGLAQISTIASQSFQKGGFPEGSNAMVRVNENGQEAILNARATRNLGSDTINALNKGANIGGNVTISPSINIQGNADSRSISQMEDSLDNFARRIEQVFERNIVDTNRIQAAFA